MRISHIFYLLCLVVLASCSAASNNRVIEQPPLKLWYDKPATEWMTSALPIGNGELGAMFFGGIGKEEVQFNEKTLWSGSPGIRGAYQNFGSLFVEFSHQEDLCKDYKREIDIDNAVGRVSYRINGISYLREYFASNPDSVIVMRLTTPGSKGKLSLNITMQDSHQGTTQITGNEISFSGKLDWLHYNARAIVVNEGGSLITDKNVIAVTDADAVTILLSAGTNYDIHSDNYIGMSEVQLHDRIETRIAKASKNDFPTLLNNHLKDYTNLYGRVKLDLKTTIPDITTDELVKNHSYHRYLDILYFQYGRYLMISSSRGIDLPNNLQGIWNNNNNPPWQCDIHTNINIQMNYWPAEVTNLSECHLPFINYVVAESQKENGSWRQVAANEGNRGWAVHTQCNIFGHTDWNINRPANAWYAMHLWQHYLYTANKEYLEEKAFPVMKNTCQYWFDRLIETEAGTLVAPDEWSPEHGPWEDGVAYAQQLIWELFTNTRDAAYIVNADTEFTNELQAKINNLHRGIEIGEWGQIKEWKKDSHKQDYPNNQHRHLSQLMALYPGNQISFHKDSLIAEAAGITLNSRGDEGTGWSRAWKIACWARLFDGDHAYSLLKSAQNYTDMTKLSMSNKDGGVYENLLDAHPPFQIDGNFGATAGIAEMLIQSNQGYIHLLPALPSAWSDGAFQGLKAEGNFTIDLIWQNSIPQQCQIISNSGKTLKLYKPENSEFDIIDSDGKTVPFKTSDNNIIYFETTVNGKYKIDFLIRE